MSEELNNYSYKEQKKHRDALRNKPKYTDLIEEPEEVEEEFNILIKYDYTPEKIQELIKNLFEKDNAVQTDQKGETNE